MESTGVMSTRCTLCQLFIQSDSLTPLVQPEMMPRSVCGGSGLMGCRGHCWSLRWYCEVRTASTPRGWVEAPSCAILDHRPPCGEAERSEGFLGIL